MFELLTDPVGVIRDFKKENMTKSLILLLATSLFLSFGFILFAYNYNFVPSQLLVLYVIGVLFGVFGSLLAFAFLYSVAMHVLDGKGGFYEGLTAVVLTMAAPSIAVFLAGILVYVPYGYVLSMLLLVYGWVLGTAIFFRAGKEYYGVDYFAVFIGLIAAKVPFWLAMAGYFILV